MILAASMASPAQAQERVMNFFLDETSDAGSFIPDPNCPLDTHINSRLALNQVREYGGVPCAQHGQMTGNVTLTSTACVLDARMRFNGGGSVEFDGYPEVDGLATNFSVAFWIYDGASDADPTERLLISGSDGSDSGWAITIRGDAGSGSKASGGAGGREIRIGRPFGVCTQAASFPVVLPGMVQCGTSADAMDHVAVTVTLDPNGTTSSVELFINGAACPTVGTLPVLTNPPGSNSVWQIGGDPLGHTCANDFGGRLTDMNIFDGVLSASQIADVIANPGFTPGTATLGTNYCTAIPNSTGVTGEISATGSDSISTNDLTLHGSSLPVSEFGIFLVGLTPTQSSVPGFNGTGPDIQLCVGPTLVGRYNQPGQIVQVDSAGTVAFSPDLSQAQPVVNFPTYSPGPIYFQFWHRESLVDPSMANMTNGLNVTLTP